MLKFTPYDYQTRGAEILVKAIDRYGSALDASPCGSGKTFTSALAFKRMGLRAGIVCVKQNITKMRDVFESLGVEVVFTENREKLRGGRTPWLTRKPKGFDWHLPPSTGLVLDECHFDGGMTSLNSKMSAAAKDYPTILLSATVAETPLQMKAVGYQLGLHRYFDYWTWALANGCTQGFFGGLEFDGDSEWGKTCLQFIHQQIFPLRGFRVSETELRDVLPDHTIVNEAMDLSAADRKKIEAPYKLIEESGLTGLTENLAERQEIELIKIPGMVEEARSHMEDGASVILALNFHKGMDLAQQLLPEAGVIDGRVLHKNRLVAQEDFQQGRTNCILLNTQSGGVSIDLHDLDGSRPRVQLLSPQFGAKSDYQMLGRGARAGALSRVLSKRLYVPDTIEEHIVARLEVKHSGINILNKGMNTEIEVISTELVHSEREHAEHSPSSLLYKSKCPGFRGDQSSDKTKADEGSLGHEAFEQGHTNMIPPELPWLVAGAKKTIEYGKVVRAKHHDPKIYKEIRVEFLDQFGYLDEFVMSGTRGDLMDPKFAQNPYEANSPQFHGYALGLWDLFPTLEEITTHVIMPYLDEIDVEVFTRSDHYEKFSLECLSIIEAAKRNDPDEFRTGPYCRFCGVKGVCPKITAIAYQVSRRYNPHELSIPDEFIPENITDPNVMAQAKAIAPILEDWSRKVNDAALRMRLEQGLELPGWELAERNKKFSVENAQAAWEVVKELGVTPEAFSAAATIQIGALEDAVARIAPARGKKKAKEDLRDKLIDAGAASAPSSFHYLKRVKTSSEEPTLTLED